MRNKDGNKWMTAERLIELLSRLPPEIRISVNYAENLLAWFHWNEDSEPIAYISFTEKSLWWYVGDKNLEEER